MTVIRTEDDIRAEKVATMGSELGELHFLLWKDVTSLHFEWNQYTELFGTHPSRIDVMNSAAPRFFWSLERVLWQDILLALSRLADPAGTRGQQNLTFRRLLTVLPDGGPKAALVSALDEYEHRSQFARNWRHSLFAHRAYDHAAEPDVHPLTNASRASVLAALEAARDLMNLLELHYQGSPTAYEDCIDPIGGAHDLLSCLERGVQARRGTEQSGRIGRATFQ
jgi:HEPN superfamily AbiU2-like protein